MTALLSMLLQGAAFVVGVYFAFTGHWLRGLALFAASQVLHWLAEKVSKGLMLVHERAFMSQDEKDRMAWLAPLGHIGAAPRAWGYIAIFSGWLYVSACSALIWFYLSL